MHKPLLQTVTSHWLDSVVKNDVHTLHIYITCVHFVIISLLLLIGDVMRVPYIEPSLVHFDTIFSPSNSVGGGINDINVYQQRGGSLFGVLGRVFKKALPFLKSLIFPEVGNFTKNIVDDMKQNVPFKQSVRKNVIKSGKNVGRKIMYGGTKQKVKTITRKRAPSMKKKNWRNTKKNSTKNLQKT